MAADDDEDVLHDALSRWIVQNGGAVHRSLALRAPTDATPATAAATRRARFSRRGVFAARGPAISEGEVLVRLPARLALDGSRLPGRYGAAGGLRGRSDSKGGGSTQRGTAARRDRIAASPWLRCLAALLRALHRFKHRRDEIAKGDAASESSLQREEDGCGGPIDFYDPYLATLPGEYDSLLNWSVAEIRAFLGGTTLGAVALQDACDANSADDSSTGAEQQPHEKALHERFVRTVVPYLAFLKDNGFFTEDEGSREAKCKDSNEPKRRKMDTEVPGNDHENYSEFWQSYPLFREGCMCISTRAFHMQSPSTMADATNTARMNDDDAANPGASECYQGPYLLPYIDLLNHAPRNSPKRVTTLRRDSDGSFVMVAERNVEIGEEICHSYDSGGAADDVVADEANDGGSLNSAQLLQTFGFLDVEEAGKRMVEWHQKKDTDSEEQSANLGNLTPAVLFKTELSRTCKQLAGSSYPDAIRKFMDQSGMSEDGWEHWPLSTTDESSTRSEPMAILPKELVIPFGASLSSELITVCSLHFLPEYAIDELLGKSTSEDEGKGTKEPQSILLGKEVLDDYFLGKLVLQAILNALKEKLDTYKVSSADLLVGCRRHEETRLFLDAVGNFYNSEGGSQNGGSFYWGESEAVDANVLSKVMTLNKGERTDLIQQFAFGTIVSLEEKACLLELKKKVLDLWVRLDGEDN